MTKVNWKLFSSQSQTLSCKLSVDNSYEIRQSALFNRFFFEMISNLKILNEIFCSWLFFEHFDAEISLEDCASKALL